MASLGYAVGLFVCLRIALSMYALVLPTAMPLQPRCSTDSLFPAPGNTPFPAVFGAWRQWDACWYEQIASVGYLPGSASVAFFPLYPALVRIVALPLSGMSGGLTFAGLLVSGSAYIAAIVGLHRLVCRDFGALIARRTIVYLSIFPSAFYLFVPYTEALFLALAVWMLYAARRSHWAWAVLATVLATLTRTQGCLLALPLLWEFVRQHRQAAEGGGWRWQAALIPLPPLAGLLLFIAYSKATTGWTTLQAQSARWGAGYRPPWVLLENTWRFIAESGNIVEVLNLALLILFLVLSLVGLRHLPFSYSLYVAPQLLLLTVRQTAYTPLASINRYLLVLFPIFIVLAIIFTRHWHHALWFASSLTLLIALVSLFLLGAFVG